MSRRTAPSCARRRWPKPAPRRCGCAHFTARSAAAPSGWSARAACRQANSSACGRHSWAARFRSRSNMAMRRSVGRRGTADRCGTVWCSRSIPIKTFSSCAADAVVEVPDGVPPARAVLAANMETALNAVWDGAPGPADRIAVVGGGVVGLLIARLCARLPGARGDARRYRAGARRSGANAWRWLCNARRGAYRMRPGLSCQRPPPKVWRRRCAARARRRRWSS